MPPMTNRAALGFSFEAYQTLWRLAGILMRPRLPDLSPAREGAPSRLAGALHANLRAMWPRPEFLHGARYIAINGYVLHIGLALVFFGYAPHIAFAERLTGLRWPALPESIQAVCALQLMLVAVEVQREAAWACSGRLAAASRAAPRIREERTVGMGYSCYRWNAGE